MNAATVIVNASSMLLYGMAVLFALIVLWELRGSYRSAPLRIVAASLLALSMLASSGFVGLNALWIAEEAWRDLSAPTNVGWIVWDWINGLAHLSFVLAIRVFVQWQPRPVCKHLNCPADAVMGAMASHSHDIRELDRGFSDLLDRIDALHTTDRSDP